MNVFGRWPGDFTGERVVFSPANVTYVARWEIFCLTIESKAVVRTNDLAKLGHFPIVILLLYKQFKYLTIHALQRLVSLCSNFSRFLSLLLSLVMYNSAFGLSKHFITGDISSFRISIDFSWADNNNFYPLKLIC